MAIASFSSDGLGWGVLLSSAIAAIVAFLLLYRRMRNAKQEQHQQQPQQHQEVPPSKQVLVPRANKTRTAIPKGLVQQSHQLLVNTLKGHTDTISGICFTSNGRGLATASGDGIVRVFKLEDASNKNIKFLHLNLRGGNSPVAVAFGEAASQLVVAAENISGASLYMYAAAGGKAAVEAKGQGRLPPPEIKWEKHQVHGSKNILTLAAAAATYGSGDGNIIIASCSEGTDVKLWSAADGRCLGTVDTNQLKNTMAALSPDGRFIAAAAFTADVKIWEIIYGKDGSVKEICKVMQLKGHKSAVTWLSFTWTSNGIVTASKDGTIRVWNINVRYQLDEDPKCLKVFPITLLDNKGCALNYDRLAVSPDNRLLAVTSGSNLQWLSLDSGNVLDAAENAHDSFITSIAWAPDLVHTEKGRATILATASVDKKVRLWLSPR